MDMSIRFPNLQIYFGYIGRSISVFGYEITIYGLLIAVGMLLGLFFVIHEAKRQNENQNLYLEMMIPAVLGGLVGARFFYVIFHWSLFSGMSVAEICDIRNGGMSLYGGILGGSLLSALFCRLRKISFQRMADTASMGLLIAQIIGVWGNFFNRESFGGYTDNLFAMQIPRSVVHDSQMTEAIESRLATVGDVSYIQVHPLFLYESVWCLLLFLVLLVYSRRKMYQGEIFLRYLAGYSLGRIAIEWLRTDSVKIPGINIPVLLPVCVFLTVVCGISATVRRILSKKRDARRRRRREENYAAEEKKTPDYDGIQTYENVSDEFWNTESPAENAGKDKESPEDSGKAFEYSEKAPEENGNTDERRTENSSEDEKVSKDSAEALDDSRETDGENGERAENASEIIQDGADAAEDDKHTAEDTKEPVVGAAEDQKSVPETGAHAPEAEQNGCGQAETGGLSENQPSA